MRIGVISDTHGLLRNEAVAELRESDLIIHAGDVGRAAVLDGLRRLAPVIAVRGNMDRDDWSKDLRSREVVEAAGAEIYVLHDLADLDLDPAGAGMTAVIFGHSHRPAMQEKNGVLYLNPGSAGPKRFTLPVTVARIVVRNGKPEAKIIELDV
jgi:putative phosphoesterase